MIRLALETVDAALEHLIDTASVLDAAELRLFTNEVDFDSVVEAGDFTAPTFTGYAPAAITWTLYTDVNGNRYVASDPIVFTPTDGANLPQLIRGAWVAQNTSGDFLAGGAFAEPLSVAVADQAFHVTIVVPIETIQPNITIEAGIL